VGLMGMDTANIPVDYWLPRTDAERKAVHKQLERLLASPLFANSKRYPALLRYVVEESLQGRTENLKERTLGIEVFKRESDYDTNADPVVRVTAGEVRKRLAQYYYEPGHQFEVHIELPSGSYAPVYRIPDPQSKTPSEQPQLYPDGSENRDAQSAAVMALPAPIESANQSATQKREALRIWLAAAVVFVVLGVVAGYVIFERNRIPNQEYVNEFWGPIVSSPDTALLCLGDRASWDTARAAQGFGGESPTNPTVDQYLGREDNVFMNDVLTLNRLATTLQGLGKKYRIKNSSETDLSDLRSGPAILIGGNNNTWTMRVTAPLRFSFAMDSEGGRIIDKKNPTQKNWNVPLSTPYRQLGEDYGIVARLKDPTTDRVVVIAAGLGAQGTASAGEMLSNPDYLKSLLSRAPADWQNKNMEAVIKTEVVNAEPGPPRVLAIDFW